MESMKNTPLVILLVLAAHYHYLHLGEAGEMRSTVWNKLNAQDWNISPSAADDVVWVRSAADCISLCTLNSLIYCVACAYDKEGGACRLFEDVSVSDRTSTLQDENRSWDLFGDEAQLCPIATGNEFVTNGAITTYEGSLTSLEGEVMCDEDYIHSSSDAPGIGCQNGEWVWQGECRQRLWTNGTAKPGLYYSLPRTPSVGWTMCFTCALNGTERWVVNLHHSEEDIQFHFEPRYQFKPPKYINMTMLNHRLFGVVGGDLHGSQDTRIWVTEPPFPFLPYKEVGVRIVSQPNNGIHVYVADRLYANYTMVLPPSNISTVLFKFQAHILHLDLWCSH